MDDAGLEELVADENCNRISEEGEEDEESVIGSDIEADVAAEGSSEEREDSSESEVNVFVEGNTEESKMSVSSNDSEDREINLNWGNFPDVDDDDGDEDSVDMQSVSDDEQGGGMIG